MNNWEKIIAAVDEYLSAESKVVKRGDEYFLTTKDGKTLEGPFDSRKKAEKRLKQIEYFKHKDGDAEHHDKKSKKKKKAPKKPY